MKNKLAPPFQQVEVDVLYGRGIWAAGDLVDRALDAGVLARSGSWLAWGDKQLGSVPVNFVSTSDTTGGNSGSPTLNGKGELVGLLFDGNYEGMLADWHYIPEITRSIHVDMRYVLWLMDYVDRAHHLLEEMGFKPAASP